jgi:uncharacterized LabA/DUF88 family protein
LFLFPIIKKEKIYAFIDSQNLNLGIKNDVIRKGKVVYEGWNLDFQKFFVYLKEKYKVDKAFLFIGKIKGYDSLYRDLEESGYDMVFKPTVRNSRGKVKGNVDAELVLEVMLQYENYDKAIITSGDGDFYCLIKVLKEKGKLKNVLVPNRYAYSSLLIPFREDLRFLDDLQKKLGF